MSTELDKFRQQKSKDLTAKKEFEPSVNSDIKDKMIRLRTDPLLFRVVDAAPETKIISSVKIPVIVPAQLIDDENSGENENDQNEQDNEVKINLQEEKENVGDEDEEGDEEEEEEECSNSAEDSQVLATVDDGNEDEEEVITNEDESQIQTTVGEEEDTVNAQEERSDVGGTFNHDVLDTESSACDVEQDADNEENKIEELGETEPTK